MKTTSVIIPTYNHAQRGALILLLPETKGAELWRALAVFPVENHEYKGIYKLFDEALR